MTEYFDVPDRWVLPDYVWRQSLRDMALDGTQGREGVALWLGEIEGNIATAHQCVLLRGPGVTKRRDQLVINADLMNQVTVAALERELILVGQIHSHGPFASTDLSYPDRYLGITEPGYLSLVAPDFGMNPHTEPQDCGVHVHEGATGWRRMTVSEVGTRFDLPQRQECPPLIVGGEA